ncbi:MAG TPA: thiol reductant ABC exporter subunit CydD [Patescibacteria group bacterium]|nr:thiol reductant ABC exporter subunit CydD [Patescibacteria group bacterium]
MNPTDRRLFASGRIARVALAAAVALGLLSAVLAIAQAGLMARAISGAFLGTDGPADLAWPLAALAGVLVARAVLAWGAEVTAQRISGAVKADLRRRLLARAVALGPRSASEARSGEIALLATRGLDALDGYFGRYLPQLGLAAIVPAAVVAFLFTVDVVAALTVALTVPLIPVFMVLIGRLSASHRARRWAALTRLAHRFLDVVAGLPTLRAYGRADAQVAILRRVTGIYRVETMATLRIAFLSALALEMLAALSVALVAVGVGLRLVAGGMTLEAGLFALILAPEAYLPLRRLGAEFHASEEGLTAASRAFEIIDSPLPPSGLRGGVPDPAGGLVVAGVSVAQPGRDALAPSNVSLTVRPGEVVAVVGPSGAGKSTLLAAVLGFLTPSAGRIAIVAADGTPTDLADLDGEAWRRRVAWAPQVPYLFAGTVAENVRLAAPDAGDAEVRAALRAVALGDLDPRLVLGERGARLSSGQRRRIGVARALVRRSPLLLLDEPTAGLDPAAEAAVLAAVRAAARDGAAVILVAHRPAAAAIADRVVHVAWAALAEGAA